jgi:ATP-dependent Lhr-like helicase
MALQAFHPAVAAWFEAAFPAPTPAQAQAWPAIQRGEHVLIAAPTGSGKTLAAFLAAIDALVRQGLDGQLEDETQIVYVSPLKALSNDVRINLEVPLAGIRGELEKLRLPKIEIRIAVRSGDTPAGERVAMRKRPPHIVVTTPESLYILLGSDSGRRMLATTRTVIVDEIHALVQSKRGSHLALSLERLDALCGQRCTRVGLSATQKPITEVARFLCGDNHCSIIDAGHQRARDLAIELTNVPLQPVMSNDAWSLVYNRLAELIEQHRTTLIFSNTRRGVERTTRHLAERLGKDAVAAHHGSLSKEKRLDAEQRLKAGQLRALVATASLELGIDIGEVDLVCQLSSPRSIAVFLQRAGRAGHAVDGISKARLFPTSRDDLAECVALLDAVRRGELDALRMPLAPLDVLAQQIVAEVACGERGEAELFELFRHAHPYRELTRAAFADVVRMLAEGYATRRGTRSAYLHRDAVNGRLRARRGARLAALTSGGAIPDVADYDVVLEPQSLRVGSVNEDFAVESMAGDIFQLGNQSYRILRVERGRVRVEDAQGAPPSIPFWLGEAPGRTDELSFAVARLREELTTRGAAATAWLTGEAGIGDSAARQLVDYYAAARIELGLLPTQSTLAMERFFDEAGGMQLVIHSPLGSRLNRAWGLSLRKRFCRSFNFELQATATEDAIVLSLSTSHSFPLDEVARYLHSNSVRDVLTQALLDAPMFALRFRWNASAALALPRFAGGAKVPPQIQRMKSEDLLATVFPDQVACLENIVGERQIPDHPLVAQTLHDCLYEAMDLDGLTTLLRKLESGEVKMIARDLTAPSQLAGEILKARPYAFLDGGEAQERRTQAVAPHEAHDVRDLGKLDGDAIDAVREEAWPTPRDADEMHEALLLLGGINVDEAQRHGWHHWLDELAASRRSTRLVFPFPTGKAAIPGTPAPWCRAAAEERFTLWVAAELLPPWRAIHPDARIEPAIDAPAEFAVQAWARDEALVELLRARLACSGVTDASTLANLLAIPLDDTGVALARLEREGTAMRGCFMPGTVATQWCDRHLLARIHRRTVQRLRREVEPVAPRDFMRFLIDWQHVSPQTQLRGPDALAAVLAQLEGFEAAAGAWESQLLPARVADYDIAWLDALCGAGRVAWTRLRATSGTHAAPVRASPIVLLPRSQMPAWRAAVRNGEAASPPLSSRAQAVVDFLDEQGASFFAEIAAGTRLLKIELEDALGELVGAGAVGADSFAGLRALLQPAARRNNTRHRRMARHMLNGIEDAGRWSLIKRAAHDLSPLPAGAGFSRAQAGEPLEHIARVLLRRWGVVFWQLLEREAGWLPAWRELRRVYQRLEARGEIRGGRFVEGISGEQFALPEAVAALRTLRKHDADGTLVCISGADPLNLAGGVLPGVKVPALASSRVVYRDGVAVATRVAGKVVLFQELSEHEGRAVRGALSRLPTRPVPTSP